MRECRVGENRLKLALLGVLALAALCAVSLTASMTLYNARSEEMPAITSPISVYDIEKALYDEDLAQAPIEIRNDMVIMPDRILARYHYDRGDIEFTADVLNQAYSIIPYGVKKHLMAVPLRISMEPALADYTDDMKAAIDELYALVGDEVVKHDIYNALSEQADKQIFFRFDKRWTALGARYAAQLFLAQQGIPAIPLAEYELHWGRNFDGEFSDIHSDIVEEDRFMYFLLPGSINWQTVTRHIPDSLDNIDETMESPAVALSRLSSFVIIGNEFVSHSILQGDEKNGRSLLVVGDRFSKFLPAWLTPYYEHVIWINLEYYAGSPEEFLSLFEEYPISDIIMIESIASWGNSQENYRLAFFTTMVEMQENNGG